MKKNRLLCYIAMFMFISGIITTSCLQAAHAGTTLKDINGHWASGQIQELVDKNVVSGYPNGSFLPEKTISRAEFIALSNRAFEIQGNVIPNYTDVSSSDWFYKDTCIALAAGYISGYPDGTMRPNQQISRQEAAVIIARALKFKNTAPSNALDTFNDAGSIAEWGRNSVALLVKAGLLSGYPDGQFKAGNPITRAESAAIFKKAIDYIAAHPVVIEEPVPEPISSKSINLGNFGGSMIIQTVGDEKSVTLMILDIAGAAAALGVTEAQITSGKVTLATTYDSEEYTYFLNEDGFFEISFLSTTLKDEAVANKLKAYIK